MKKKLLVLSVAALLAFAGCRKSEELDEPTSTNTSTNTGTNNNNNNTNTQPVTFNPATITVNSTTQFYCKIDGVAYHIELGKDGGDAMVGKSSSVGTDKTTTKYTSTIYTEKNSTTSLMISKGTLTFCCGQTAPESAFYGFFKKGTLTFSPNGVDGIGIGLYINGKSYSTGNAPADQTGSKFEYVDILTGKDAMNNAYVAGLAKFNCKVYSADGEVKTITDGVMRSMYTIK